ncbi:hypothetical protein [Vibrio metschnikovii]|uniref:hypothetical protein n=1 Tax=Vibrio metschnikovii TaxID=28172 RepID=UPI001C2F4239|nr:hypothetical protein [Vibrio metschnikovii]MDA3140177.1 hypothetical protein [Vibrio metschnikovii]
MDIWNKVEKIFRFFFPEFSNKVTWAVVIAGLGLTSTSLLQNLLNWLLSEQFDIKLFDEYDALIGLALVALGLTHNILLQREKTKIEINATNLVVQVREHDVNLFKKITTDFEEHYLTDYLSSICNDHSYLSSQKYRVMDFINYIDESEYEFLNDTINERFQKFGTSLQELMEWASEHFFDFPSNVVLEDQRYCLYPELNHDRGGEFDTTGKYRECAKTAFEMTQEVAKNYKSFRSEVKRQLYI